MLNRMQLCIDNVRESLKSLQSRYGKLIQRNDPQKELTKFLKDKSVDHGYFIIVGEPGIGKTGFCLSLYKTSTICYPFQVQTKLNNFVYFLNYLAAELHLRIYKESSYPVWIEDPFEAHDRVNHLLKRIGQKCNRKNPFLIILDAINEAVIGGNIYLNLLKFNLPPHVYVIGTVSPEARLMDQLECHHDIHTYYWKRSDDETITEVNNYIDKILQKDINDTININVKILSHGNILVASRLLDICHDEKFFLMGINDEILNPYQEFHYEWEYRLLNHVDNKVLCENIATILTVAQEPLSLSIIRAALNILPEQEKVKGRDVERAVKEMSKYFVSIKSDDVLYIKPFHPEFLRMLNNMYRNDFYEAHYALAIILLKVIKNCEHQDFEYAARYACWHLRQSAKHSWDSSEKTNAKTYLDSILKDNNLRINIERRFGINFYLNCFLHEAVKLAYDENSLPNMILDSHKFLRPLSLLKAGIFL